jgi:hypothetical protein
MTRNYPDRMSLWHCRDPVARSVDTVRRHGPSRSVSYQQEHSPTRGSLRICMIHAGSAECSLGKRIWPAGVSSKLPGRSIP